ncbi:hypothetical protein OIDMADRAFT_20445 [Oidiodendron maius Zn]|uniref:Uncharacterized protein n=1 Tax=Oidiodendron maius (strain Zn) TaxID=913774 RepID=A0A0C3GM06_OIDMZ|nr:hypothetical protein OIDMADRAFT_20445 [Oidiodendron maius Zn]
MAKEAAESRRRQENYNRARGNVNRSAAGASIFGSTPHLAKADCLHDGWWPKLEGKQRRESCEKCGVSRHNYLLQCPSCSMLACASC